MTTITTTKGLQGTLTVDTKAQTAVVTVNGVTNLVLFVRNNKVVVKNDMILNGADLASAKAELSKTLKSVVTTKKGR